MQSIEKLLSIMAKLRDPDKGCPWDRVQDFKSIAPHTIEEAYEVADAIDQNNMDLLKDELGDLLFQVVYHSRLASELDQFRFEDVVESITDKILRRHPHVFAGEQVDSARTQSRLWEQIKSGEKSGGLPDTLLLDNVPANLPAMQRAQKLQTRAASVGFDWNNITGVIDKIREELTELDAELVSGSKQSVLTEEVGDLLFSCINLARHLGISAEGALRFANRKFLDRFHYIEECLRKDGKDLNEASQEEMETLWQKAKQEQFGII